MTSEAVTLLPAILLQANSCRWNLQPVSRKLLPKSFASPKIKIRVYYRL
jgi:hypothetical protein